MTASERIRGLGALRAFALLLGIVLHPTMTLYPMKVLLGTLWFSRIFSI